MDVPKGTPTVSPGAGSRGQRLVYLGPSGPKVESSPATTHEWLPGLIQLWGRIQIQAPRRTLTAGLLSQPFCYRWCALWSVRCCSSENSSSQVHQRPLGCLGSFTVAQTIQANCTAETDFFKLESFSLFLSGRGRVSSVCLCTVFCVLCFFQPEALPAALRSALCRS